MSENLRWIVGGLAATFVMVVGLLVSAQARVDAAQNASIRETREQAVQYDLRQDDLIARISDQQSETSATLRGIAETLRLIDERGTKAFLEQRK